MNEIKENFSRNLIFLRKSKKLTQIELAAHLNYSDKSISKWENQDTIPDIEALKNIALFFNVTVDYLITPHNEKEAIEATKPVYVPNDKKRWTIILLYVSIIWIAATIIYVQDSIVKNSNHWMLFVWAVPASVFLIVIFKMFWFTKKHSMLLTSVLIWTLLVAFYLQFLEYNVWVIFFLGVPLQLANILIRQLNKYEKRPRK